MKPTIFISSTIDDFKIQREVLEWSLGRSGYKAKLSESINFDLHGNNSDPFSICFKNIDDADLVIHRIGCRAGNTIPWEGEEITISMAEYLYARKKSKYIHIYCDEIVRKECKLIDNYSKKFKIPKSKAFVKLKECENPIQMQKFHVYKNYKKVTSQKVSAYVKHYTTLTSLLDAIYYDLNTFNLIQMVSENASNEGLRKAISGLSSERLKTYVPDYDPNISVSALLLDLYKRVQDGELLSGTNGLQILKNAKRSFNINLERVVNAGKGAAEDIDSKSYFFAIENSFENASPAMWELDQKIIDYLVTTKNQSNRFSDGFERYSRIFLFSSVETLLENLQQIKTVSYLGNYIHN